jgi:hypothetical protein
VQHVTVDYLKYATLSLIHQKLHASKYISRFSLPRRNMSKISKSRRLQVVVSIFSDPVYSNNSPREVRFLTYQFCVDVVGGASPLILTGTASELYFYI